MNNLKFKIMLVRKRTILRSEIHIPYRNYSEELDNISSILFNLCEVIADADIVDFIVEGFGQSPWPLDIHFDLLTIVDQLSDIIANMRTSQEFTMDFYEQGTERTLTFVPNKKSWLVQCRSDTSWIPDPDFCDVPKLELEKLLSNLAKDFIELANRIAPNLTRHKWFVDWKNSMNTSEMA